MMRKLKVQPIQSDVPEEQMKPQGTKSRLVRLIPSVLLRTSSSEKVCPNEDVQLIKDGSGEFEPSSVCLAKMVVNFMEESNSCDQMPVRCGRRRCKCFNGIDDYSSDDEPDCFGGCFGDSNGGSAVDACENLKSLVPCTSIIERNLLADTAKIAENNKACKQKDEACRRFVTDGLVALGYNASICKSRWEKAPSYPAGEYEYIDVIHEGERLLIDIDFRSEFEIARPTKTYKTILQTLPVIYVGQPTRLQKMICIVTDAVKQSLKNKGLHYPPWRKPEYVKSKWLAPHTRVSPTPEPLSLTKPDSNPDPYKLTPGLKSCPTDSEPPAAKEEPEEEDLVFPLPDGEDKVKATPTIIKVVPKEWSPKPPHSVAKRKSGLNVTGLASIMKKDD